MNSKWYVSCDLVAMWLAASRLNVVNSVAIFFSFMHSKASKYSTAYKTRNVYSCTIVIRIGISQKLEADTMANGRDYKIANHLLYYKLLRLLLRELSSHFLQQVLGSCLPLLREFLLQQNQQFRLQLLSTLQRTYSEPLVCKIAFNAI